MKHLVPRRRELVLFGVLAVVCAVIVGLLPAQDLGLSALSVPVCILAALLGMRRKNSRATAAPAAEAAEVERQAA